MTALAVVLGAALGAVLHGVLNHRRPVTGWPLVAVNCAAALGVGGLAGFAPVLTPAVLAGGTGLLAALSPLTGLGRRGADDGVRRAAVRFGGAVLAHLIYAGAFAVLGFVLTFAVIKSWGY